jgi:hypothetical protein
MGRPESCFHAEPNRFHGEKSAGQGGNGKKGVPGKIRIRIGLRRRKGVIMHF